MATSSNRQKDIFLKALDIASSGERAAYLAQACDGDEAMRRQIDAMLKAHVEPDSFLEKPAAMGLTVDASDALPMANILPDAQIGTRIGPYKLLEQIGEGGMGVVYTADQQEPVRRNVALKIIKPGMDSGQVLARFEAERQALALMDHPNIAKVLDAGATKEGRPFFVMELVKGTPITKFCDERRLSPRERLELFMLVCLAIQHAHQKGVIHRDIKPSNVLVALYDDKPVPKVIDFGVAKATGQALTEKTLDTGFGAIVGTPEYMSPEQATFNQLDIDTRSDVYALGVLLYELLTGTTPVNKARLKEAALLEVLRIVREDEPPRPSIKLSTSKASATIAKTCGIDASELSRLLRGELDWIVMKSLEKDRNRRYDTAASLARDVERYLKDELVEARPPSLAYRLQKTFRKNRGLVIAASVVLFTLLGGIVGTTWGMFRAIDAENETAEWYNQAEKDLVRALTAEGKALLAEEDAKHNERKAKEARDETVKALELSLKNEKEARYQALRADTSRHAFQMEAVFRAWQRQDMLTATRVLGEVPAAFQKTWECRFLRDLCARQGLPIFDPTNHRRQNIDSWAISPDGNTIALQLSGLSPKDPNRLALIDARTGREKTSIPLEPESRFGHSDFLVFSPDSKRLAYATQSAKKTGPQLTMMDVEAPQKASTLVADLSVIYFRSQFSPDGKQFALPCHRKGLHILDSTTGAKMLHIPASGDSLYLVAFSNKGEQLAVAESKGLSLFAAADGKKIRALTTGDKYGRPAVKEASFSPDGKSVLAYLRGYGPHFDTVKVWDAQTGKERFARLPLEPSEYGHWGNIDVGFADEGKSVVIVSKGPHVKTQVFDVETGKEKPLTLPLGRTTCRHVDAQGERILIMDDRYLFSRRLAPAAMSMALQEMGEGDFLYQAAFDPDGRIRAVHGEWSFGVWDPATGKRFAKVSYRPSEVSFDTTGVSHDVKCMVRYELKEQAAKVFEAETGKVLAVLPCGDSVRKVVVSSNGERLITLDGYSAKLWDVPRKQVLFDSDIAGYREGVFSHDSRMAATALAHSVDLWDARIGKKIARLDPGLHVGEIPWLKQMQFAPDGKRILTLAGHDRRTDVVQVWDTAKGTRLKTFQIENVTSGDPRLVTSPDGTRFAYGNDLYDMAFGQRVFAFPSDVNIRAFSPDGRRILASYREDKKLRYGVFDAP